MALSPPSAAKQPRVAGDPEDFYKQKPVWRFGRVALRDPFGWHQLDAATLHFIREKLANFESMTWSQILVQAKKQNHQVSIADLCLAARQEASRLQLDVDELCSLRLAGTQRVWGILAGGVFQLLWWDPSHAVCPSIQRHT